MSKNNGVIKISENSMDYWKTFFTTLFIVVMFVVLNIFYMMYSILNGDSVSKKSNIDAVFESYLVDILIDKNIEFSKDNPKNYAVNMRLGILYSYKKDYNAAEKEFQKSIEKAVSVDYTPNYQLAKLYVKMNRLQDAQDVMDKIGEKPNKRLIRFKGDVYSLLGDSYFEEGYYALSVIKYEKSMSYYEIIKDKNLQHIKVRFVNSCIALADKYVQVGKIDEAIMSLEKAYELNPENVLLNYKLGILYIDNDPYKAFDLLSFVQKNEPQVLNYDIYYDLIYKLAEIEKSKGNITNSELYLKKAKYYQKYVKNNLLYDKDLYIDVEKKDVHVDIAAQEYIMSVQFRLQNNSGMDIDNLSVKAVFKEGDDVVQTFSQKIYGDDKIFDEGITSPPFIISASAPYKVRGKKNVEDFTVEIYAYKYPKFQVKLYSGGLSKPNVSE